ncbi:MAG: MBG domain-containing protein [Actinomycetes bacterium]
MLTVDWMMMNVARHSGRIARTLIVTLLSSIFVALFAPTSFAATGDLDTTFASSGFLTSKLGTSNQIFSMTFDSSGRIVAGGTAVINGSYRFVVVRYLASGVIDTTFGTNGYATASIGTRDRIFSIAIDSTGRIVAGGGTIISNIWKFALLRFLPNGALDTSFGSSGFTTSTPGINDQITSIAIDSSDRIIAGGYAAIGGSYLYHFALGRYLSTGVLDTTFGTSGFNTTTSGTSDQIHSILIDSAGRIIAGGSVTKTNQKFALARYLATGALDTTFGTSGFTLNTPGTSDQINSLAIDSSGRILAGGYATTSVAYAYHFAIARYTSSGAVDTSFATAGFNTTTVGSADQIDSIALDSQGRVIAGGWSTNGNIQPMTLAGYLATGAIDTTFGTSGFTTATRGNSDAINAVLIDGNGAIYAGGEAFINNDANFLLARYVGPPRTQSALTITTTTGTYATPLTLSTAGGSGSGSISYSTTTPGCAISVTGVLTETGTLSCTVVASKGADSAYLALQSPPTVITLAKAPLAVIPSDTSTVYGSLAQYDFTYQGFVNGESVTASSFTTGLIAPLCSSSDTSTTSVAQSPLAITCSGGSAQFYFFTYPTAGRMTISPLPITVTPVLGQSKTFGTTDPILNYRVISGALVSGETLTGGLSYEGSGESATVGSHTYTLGTLANPNYAISLVPGDSFTVNAVIRTQTVVPPVVIPPVVVPPIVVPPIVVPPVVVPPIVVPPVTPPVVTPPVVTPPIVLPPVEVPVVTPVDDGVVSNDYCEIDQPEPKADPAPSQPPAGALITTQGGISTSDLALKTDVPKVRAKVEIVTKPDLIIHSMTPKLLLSKKDALLLKKLEEKVVQDDQIKCVGYIYKQGTTVAKATALAKSQATALCLMIKKKTKAKTIVTILDSSKAPKEAKSSKWLVATYVMRYRY